MDDLISRQQAIDEIHEDAEWLASQGSDWQVERMERDKSILMSLPSAQPERKKMSNKEWVDFLSEQFTVSRTSAREMLHGLMRWKAEDNFKKQFSGGRNESRRM